MLVNTDNEKEMKDLLNNLISNSDMPERQIRDFVTTFAATNDKIVLGVLQGLDLFMADLIKDAINDYRIHKSHRFLTVFDKSIRTNVAINLILNTRFTYKEKTDILNEMLRILEKEKQNRCKYCNEVQFKDSHEEEDCAQKW